MRIKISALSILLVISAVIGVAISYSHFYLFHVVLILLLTALFIRIIQNKGKINLPIHARKYHYMFYFMFIWYLLSIIWSVYPPYSVQYIFYIFCGMSVALTIVYYGYSLEKLQLIFKAISIVFIIEVFFSLLEAYTRFRLPISPFSHYVHYFGRQGSELNIFTPEVQEYLHSLPTGFQWNPNNLAATMCIILPFLLFHENRIVKLFGSISVISIIYATDSRGALLAALFIVIGYCLLYIRKYSKLFFSLSISISISIVFLVGAVFVASSFDTQLKFSIIGESIEATRLFISEKVDTDNSIGIRQNLIYNGLEALASTNGLGVGGGASNWIQESDHDLRNITSMHNFWIEILVEGGVIFFIIFMTWYFLIFFQLYKTYYKTDVPCLQYFSGASSLSLLGFIPAAISPSSCIYLLPMWILLGWSVALINVDVYHKLVLNREHSCT